jgi:hypothetical protein
MPEKENSPFKLNPTRIFILAMGLVVVLIAVSMMMGGLGQYEALRDASRAAKEPTAEQVQGQ